MAELALVNDLYNRCYRADRPLAEAEWLYKGNPYGEGVIFGAFDGHDRLVGVRPTIAWKFVWSGHEKLAYQFTDAIVAPEHRGQGIFTRLVKDMCEWADEYDVGLYSFPNQNSLPIYLKSGRLEYAVRCRAQVKILSWPRYLRYRVGRRRAAAEPEPTVTVDEAAVGERETFLTPIGRFESDFEDVHADLGSIAAFTLRRKEFLNWRYFEAPARRYHVALVQQAGQPHGFVAARMIHDVMHVLDVFVRPATRLVERMPRLLTRWARQLGATAIYFDASRGNLFQRAFHRNGFLLTRKTGGVVLDRRSLSELASSRDRSTDAGDVYLVRGDSDHK
jgi:GNAT superfamily N-acetyltransferase